MSRPNTSSPSFVDLAPTIDRHLSDVSATPAPPRHRVELLAGSAAGLGTQTRQLLATRLRSAAIALFAVGTLLWIWRSLETGWAEYHTARFAKMLVLVDVVLGASALFMCTRCPNTLRWLRLWELLIFGFPSLFLALDQYDAMATCCAANDPHMLSDVMWGLAIAWYTLMFTYSLFIPNTWRRAAVILGLMAATPVVMGLIGRNEHPILMEYLSGQDLGRLSLTLLVAWLVGVTGVRQIGLLRREAFEARQLGQYYLKERIGAGGMGEVYLAEHQLLKRPCAIKIIRPSQSADPRALARFEREVRAAAGLSHWNSIEIFDYGRADDGTFYYVMEYLPGLDLGTLVERYGPLPADRVIHFVRQTCDALREAHRQGLIHRDIKPGNLFAAQRGGVYDVAKLLDFGLVKGAELAGPINVTQEGTVTGSPLFMSPEQALGETSPDGRSDIYSLGAVAYFLLTGRPPFERDTAMKVLFAHAHDPVAPPTELRPQTPRDLEAVVLRCLAKRPADRYPSVDDLRRALDACADAGGWTDEDAAAWWRDAGAPREATVKSEPAVAV